MIAGYYRSRILAARQLRKEPHDVIQATTSEGLAQGPYMAVSGIRISDLPHQMHRTPPMSHHAPAGNELAQHPSTALGAGQTRALPITGQTLQPIKTTHLVTKAIIINNRVKSNYYFYHYHHYYLL